MIALAKYATVDGVRWAYALRNGAAELGQGSVYTANNTIPRTTEGGIIIPSSLSSYAVVKLDNGAFLDCDKITSITVPNSVTIIGNGVFEGCSSLTTIALPDSITSIGNVAFGNCVSLTEISIPGGVTSLTMRQFMGCSGLLRVAIPVGMKEISNDVFSDSAAIRSVSLPSTFKVSSVFPSSYASITSISVPPECEILCANAYDGCLSLTEIMLPTNLLTVNAALNPVRGWLKS